MDKKNFEASYSGLLTLYTYYGLCIIVGCVLSTLAILHTYTFFNEYSIMVISVCGCLGSTLVGSGIFYRRKLYKLSINNEFQNTGGVAKVQKLGIFMYFLFRPIFAITFSLLIIIAIKVSIIIICVKDQTLDYGFIYLTMFLSFFAGFSSGDILGILEQLGKNKMEKFFGNHE